LSTFTASAGRFAAAALKAGAPVSGSVPNLPADGGLAADEPAVAVDDAGADELAAPADADADEPDAAADPEAVDPVGAASELGFLLPWQPASTTAAAVSRTRAELSVTLRTKRSSLPPARTPERNPTLGG
jgi:hypothetical protein